MAYCRAEDGAEFGGLSEFQLGLGSDGLGIDPIKPPTGALSEDALKALAIANPAKYKAYLSKLSAAKVAQKAADAVIDQMKKDSKYGAVFAEAVKGARNPKAVADRAKAWASEMTGGLKNFDEDALRMFYSQAYAGLDLIDGYMTVNPVARSVMQDIGKGIGLFGQTAKQVKKFQAEGIDAGGVVDAAMLVSKTAGFVNSIVQRSTMSATGKKVFGEITDWVGIATGCAAGVSVSGPIGAMGCAAAGIIKLFGMMGEALKGPDYQTPDPVNIPMGIFQPSSTQMPQVVADAIRLASVLKYRYGIKSWEQILPKAQPLSDYEKKYNRKFMGQGAFWQGYPEYNPYSDRVPTPFACTPAEAWTIVSNVVAVVNGLKISSPGFMTSYPSGYFVRQSSIGDAYRAGGKHGTKGGRGEYTLWGDLDIESLYYGARYCRDAGWRSMAKGKVNLDSPQIFRYRLKEEDWVCCLQRYGVSLQTDLIYSELVNYFMAVMVHQINQEKKSVDPLLYGDLPVTYWYCATNMAPDNSSPRQAQSRYSPHVFTMMWGEGGCNKYFNPKDRGKIATNWSHKGNYCAIRELGHIRLMAALSYIQMMYKWGRNPKKIGSKGEDMIADLDKMTSNVPGHMLRLPVNPRTKYDSKTKTWGKTPSVATLKAQLLKLSKRMALLQSVAKKKAAADKTAADATQVAQVDPKLLAQFQQAARGAISTADDPMVAAIKSGAVKLQTLYAAKRKCMKSGGAWYEGGAACDVNPTTKKLEKCRAPTASDYKTYTCVPSGTPGSTPITEASLKEEPGAPAGVGAGTILTVAGAGLLLMRLLKT
jgi:chorismate mutase